MDDPFGDLAEAEEEAESSGSVAVGQDSTGKPEQDAGVESLDNHPSTTPNEDGGTGTEGTQEVDREPTDEANSEDAPEPNTEPAGEDVNETEEESDADDESADLDDTPAFEFSEAVQKSIYPHRDVWEEFELSIQEAMPELQREYGTEFVRRELHDAALRVILDNQSEMKERAVAAREAE